MHAVLFQAKKKQKQNKHFIYFEFFFSCWHLGGESSTQNFGRKIFQWGQIISNDLATLSVSDSCAVFLKYQIIISCIYTGVAYRNVQEKYISLFFVLFPLSPNLGCSFL